MAFLAILAGIAVIVLKIVKGINPSGWASIAVMIVFFSGINFFILGVIGEYIGHIFDEVKNRPAFLIERTLGVP